MQCPKKNIANNLHNFVGSKDFRRYCIWSRFTSYCPPQELSFRGGYVYLLPPKRKFHRRTCYHWTLRTCYHEVQLPCHHRAFAVGPTGTWMVNQKRVSRHKRKRTAFTVNWGVPGTVASSHWYCSTGTVMQNSMWRNFNHRHYHHNKSRRYSIWSRQSPKMSIWEEGDFSRCSY